MTNPEASLQNTELELQIDQEAIRLFVAAFQAHLQHKVTDWPIILGKRLKDIRLKIVKDRRRSDPSSSNYIFAESIEVSVKSLLSPDSDDDPMLLPLDDGFRLEYCTISGICADYGYASKQSPNFSYEKATSSNALFLIRESLDYILSPDSYRTNGQALIDGLFERSEFGEFSNEWRICFSPDLPLTGEEPIWFLEQFIEYIDRLLLETQYDAFQPHSDETNLWDFIRYTQEQSAKGIHKLHTARQIAKNFLSKKAR